MAEIPRDILIRTLANHTSHDRFGDEILHRGVGRSDVEYWTVGPISVWRVRFIPKGVRRDSLSMITQSKFIAEGVAWTLEDAHKAARKAAREHAKQVKANQTESDRLGL